MKTIAFIGLGRMGLPMAGNLLKAGYQVTGCDVDPVKCQAFLALGGRTAAAPAQAAADADITLSIIMNDAILHEVAFGENGVLRGARAGHIYCDLSTVSPLASARVRAQAQLAGAGYLCGKVAGSIGLAQTAGLTLFASGGAQDFAIARPVFEAMAANVLLVGEGEAAAYLKLVHSLIVGTYSAMIGEALAFGEKGGLSLETMVDVLEAGPLGSRQLTLKAPILKGRQFASPPSDIDTAAKDVDIILDTARRDHTPLPLMSAARQVMAFAQATGGGKRDIYSVVEAFEQLAGLGRHANA